MQSVWKTISFWGKKKVRNNFHNKEKLDFVFQEKKKRWWLKVAFASVRFFRLWTSFRWSWRSKPLARLKTRISSPTSTAYLLRQNTSSFGGVDFASKQKIDISCFCWQFFPFVFTHRLPMKVPVVISILCFVVFQTAAPCHAGECCRWEIIAASFLTIKTRNLSHMQRRKKKGKTVRTMELQQRKTKLNVFWL